MRISSALWLLVAGLTVLVYAYGLNGPFLFDDHIHITQNRWVKIDSLDLSDLAQAWNSSFSNFPANRPLAQLSFGINHALAGVDPWAFKTTNLAIHLLTGLVVFMFARLALRAVQGHTNNKRQAEWLALATAAFWLLHPMQVSTVLYTVQRMAQISSLGMLLALSCYIYGRLQIADGKSGRTWILAAAPIALIGFLGKENAALLPLLLLVAELTLLRNVSTNNSPRFVRAIWVGYIALPLIAGAAYMATHIGQFSYDGRPFTLEERLLTQARALWLYLKWLLVPDISAFGLFHDDLTISTGLLSPPTTLLAVLGWLIMPLLAFAARSKAPVFAFAVLFYLANHVLESSVIPLEMMFEHRNYLANLGPLLLLSYLVVVSAERLNYRFAARALGVLLLVSYTVVTFIRVENWSSLQTFALNAAENHPQSRRSNFLAAQVLISALGKHQGDIAPLEKAANHYLDAGLAIDENCFDCLFGKVILALHLGRQPSAELLQRLRTGLRDGDVGPTQISISQFSFLSRWHQSDSTKLGWDDIESIFEAALANPRWNRTGRAGLEAAYREYHENVTGDLVIAERHARNTVRAWPEQWGYHMHLIRVLRKQGRHADALIALEHATPALRNERQRKEYAALNDDIRRHM